VLKTYEEMEGRPLTEIFLHSRSDISGDEFEGYREACPHGVKVVGIRVRSDRHGVRLFRTGSHPVLRGTFWKLGERRGFLWASGFGAAEINQVAQDILGEKRSPSFKFYI